MTQLCKKTFSIFLSICILAGMMVGLCTTTYAAETTVTIESFVRGEQADLRSSELLVAKVEGYDGNVHDLVYEWTSTMGTYVYVYNSHNMYGINDTDGEIEIHNTSKRIYASSNMTGRSYDSSFSGSGFAYAAVYGADLNAQTGLVGTITVTVKDSAGNVIGTDSHTGTTTRVRENRKWVYKYAGFVPAELAEDISNIAFGIFEGNDRSIKDLLGESSILHITCTECDVTSATVTSGSEYISISGDSSNYHIHANKAGTSVDGGDGEVQLTIEKGNCKFHNDTEASATTKVYVYKKPIPVPTTTSITLAEESLDSRCRYFINGVEATTQADGTIIFTDLTPNTDYQIEVVGKTTDTDASYAYVYTKTLPVFNANVEVYLNGTYDSETGTVTSGTRVDLTDVGEADNDLFVKEVNSNVFVELVYQEKGKYSVGVENGVYRLYQEAEADTILGGQFLNIDGANRTRYLFYYSVTYDTAGGTGGHGTEYFLEADSVSACAGVPVKPGYTFLGWKDAQGVIYQPGDIITEDIERAYVLTAQWEKDLKAEVNLKVIVDHTADGGKDPNVGGDMTVDLVYRQDSSEPYVEFVDHEKTYSDWFSTGTRVGDVTTWEENGIFVDLNGKFEYSANVFIDSYQVLVENSSVTKTTDAEGNSKYDVVIYMKYNPDLFNLTYNTVADDSIPDELIPKAVDIKVLAWNTSVRNKWAPITRHEENSVDVAFSSADGRHGSGSYGVPVYNNGETSYYRIEATGLTLADGTEILFKTNDGINYTSIATDSLAEGAYTAKVTVDGGKADIGGLDGAYGVYISETPDGKYVQQGVITATVYVHRYDVIFQSNGGSAIATIEDRFTIPSVREYIPTRDGYTFDGWFTDSALTQAVIPETPMSSDVTLYAKWLKNKKITGTVSVAGTYELDGEIKEIYDQDRATHVTVLLQKIDANGYANTVNTTTVNLTYTDDLGKGTYEFANVPNDGGTYRIKVMNANYGELYQNSSSSSNNVSDFASYDAGHFTAIFDAENAAVVNAYLPYDPAIFDLKYEIDATLIGEGYRPSNVGTLILGNLDESHVNPREWAVISQLKSGEGYETHDTVLNNGTGSNQYPVWTSLYDGTTLYDYAIRVATYDGKEYSSDTAPFRISYNGTARYSALSGQTQVLKATLIPDMYPIIFNLNAGEDEVLNMDAYFTTAGIYEDMYYWSYGKVVEATPARAGYKFLGWFDDNGNQVTSVPASQSGKVNLTAKWEKADFESYINNYAYIFGYNDTTMGAEGPLLRCEVSAMVHRLVKQNGKLGDFIYDRANPSFADIAGEWFQSGIEFAHHRGSFKVAEGGNVQPYITVTRGEAFKIVALGLGFTDDTTLSNEGYAEILNDYGYIIGDESGDLNVGGAITRAEFCTMYNRIIGRAGARLEDANGNDITAETYGFTDLDSGMWYYADMVRATSAYDDNGYVDLSLRGKRNNLDDYGN